MGEGRRKREKIKGDRELGNRNEHDRSVSTLPKEVSEMETDNDVS